MVVSSEQASVLVALVFHAQGKVLSSDLLQIIRNYSLMMTAKIKKKFTFTALFFESPSDSRVHISLDTALKLTKTQTYTHTAFSWNTRVDDKKLYAWHVQRMKCYAKQNQIAESVSCSLALVSTEQEYKVNGVLRLFSLSHRMLHREANREQTFNEVNNSRCITVSVHGWINNRLKLKTLENYKCDY